MLGMQKSATYHGSRLTRDTPIRPSRAVLTEVRQRNVIIRSTGWADPKQNASEKSMFGDNFGARDATAAELESNFSDKVLGNFDTAHVIKIPDSAKRFLGIGAQKIKPLAQLTRLENKEVDLNMNQVQGWRVAESATRQSLTQEWKGKDAASTAELVKLLGSVVAGDDYTPAVMEVKGENIFVELFTESRGGLTTNDFIIASRMNEVPVTELIAKKKIRYWA